MACEAVKKACALMKSNFTCLADFCDMKLLGVPDTVKEVQTILSSAGLGKIASVWNEESFAKFIVDSSAQKMGEQYDQKRKIFNNRIEAESWLDE